MPNADKWWLFGGCGHPGFDGDVIVTVFVNTSGAFISRR